MICTCTDSLGGIQHGPSALCPLHGDARLTNIIPFELPTPRPALKPRAVVVTLTLLDYTHDDVKAASQVEDALLMAGLDYVGPVVVTGGDE